MIFVTVGTHEQQFDRLVKKIDDLKRDGSIREEVVIQTGYSTYVPRYCSWFDFLSCDEMERYISEARIVITHGGPSSFIRLLQLGKVPVVVPRQKLYGEHVNDHQVKFTTAVKERYGNVIMIRDMEELEYVIRNYEKLTGKINIEWSSNNARFNTRLEKIVGKLLKK